MAAFRFANDPVTVIDDAPLTPEVNVSPVVDFRLRVPSMTESDTESELPDAPASAALIVPEKVYVPFSIKLTDNGAVTVAGWLDWYPAKAVTRSFAMGEPSPDAKS